MKYSFDDWGWFTLEVISNRQTEIVPPQCGEPVVGELYPNFTGYEWIMLPYVTPIPIPPPPPPPPPVVSILTPLEFLNRFTDEEALTIISLSKTNPSVELWWIKYNKAQDIDLNDPQTIDGVTSLAAEGILSPGRAVEILTKYPV